MQRAEDLLFSPATLSLANLLSLKMDSVKQAEKLSEETVEGELLLSDASDPHGVLGSPLVEPRVGDEYQAKIPPMLTLSQLLELSKNPIESEARTDIACSTFLMGLPLPITWICKEANTSKDANKKTFHDPKSERPLNEKEAQSKVDMASGFPVPGLSPEPWNDFEVEAFTLGLYIFGKNLLQVQTFMESKDMGQLQSFYYGRFYKSLGYCKWVDCRKMRNKKCVLGSKIFTGCRQQEFLSRLLPRLSEESKSTLQEISNALVEERTSLEEYVSTLKSMVGIRALVEAIGIGKGKEDLTTLITDNSKSSHRLRVRAPELPSGKACSSLTTEDIIKFLTSDFRLSKARSNDLFWEAVWPRLLAKGWHSEQPNDICTAPKNTLVFLMPGVKKFSRRKLMNGTHYFDSVSDVLSKVASEPKLLDMEDEEATPESNDGAVNHVDDQKDMKRPCYLKPQVAANLMKFTVIDTSLPSKVRELRSLPAQKKHLPFSPNRSRVNGIHLSGCFNSNCCKDLPNGDVSQKVKSEGTIEKSGEKQEDHKALKHHLSHREKCGSNHVGLVVKRRRMDSCKFTDMDKKQEEPSYVLSLPANTDKSFTIRECSPRSKRSLSRPPTPVTLTDRKLSPECDRESKPQLLIDLNLPIVSMEPIMGEPCYENASVKCNITDKTEPMESSISGEEISEEVQNASSRRQSTRNRPLTTKALEALEIGLLSLKESRKRASARSLDHKTRPITQARSD